LLRINQQAAVYLSQILKAQVMCKTPLADYFTNAIRFVCINAASPFCF